MNNPLRRPSKNITCVGDLLALDGTSFIDAAYRTLLKRSPDPTGMSHYMRLIRGGSSKMNILTRICLSSEGRQHSSRVPGLRWAIARYLLFRRLTSWWCRPISQLEGDTPIECRLRAMEQALMRIEQERASEQSVLDASVEDVARLLVAIADKPIKTPPDN
jgi:hypothetical protein